MKYFVFSLILLFSFSCKKEKEKTLQDYVGTYKIEGVKMKYVINYQFFCGTGMDSLELHIADSLRSLEPTFWADTIISIDTIKISPSENSENELVVEGLFDEFGGADLCYFFNPNNTQKLEFLNSNNDWKNDTDYPSKNELLEGEMLFDFKIYRQNYPVWYTFKGKAVRLNMQ